MGQLVLGKTPKQLEEEKARKNQALQNEIIRQQDERAAKIAALHRKQRSIKTTTIVIVVVVALILIVFGTYNTFFKTPITKEEVTAEAKKIVAANKYPSEGLDNYLRDNCEDLFNKYMSIGKKGSDIAKIEVLKDTCRISKVQLVSSSAAKVFFSLDVSVTSKDHQVTDPVLIEKLRKNGFNSTQVTISTNTNGSMSMPSKGNKDNTSEESNTEDNNTITTEPQDETSDSGDSSNIDNEPIVNEEITPTIAPTEAPVITPEVDVYVPIEQKVDVVEQIDFSVNAKETPSHYYLLQNGVIMESGKTTKNRYNFFIFIEKFSEAKDGKVVRDGYKPTTDLHLYSLVEVNQVEFEDNINTSTYFEFNKKAKVTAEELQNMQLKVGSILEDLYNYKDTKFDFQNYKKFNTYDAIFDGIVSFEAYTQPNQLGFNALVTYNITTTQGFSFTTQAYLLIEKNGNSYMIKDFL